MLGSTLDIYNSILVYWYTGDFVILDPEKTNINIGLCFCSSFAVFPLVLQEYDNNTFSKDCALIILQICISKRTRHCSGSEKTDRKKWVSSRPVLKMMGSLATFCKTS